MQTLLHLTPCIQRVCLNCGYSSLRWYPPVTRGNVVKQLFQQYQTQYLDILCKLFWTMECACKRYEDNQIDKRLCG